MKNSWTSNTQISSVPELISLDQRLGRVQWWIISPGPHGIKGGLFLFCKKGFWVYKNWLSSLQFHLPYSKILSMMYQEINITSGCVVLGAKYNWDKYYPRCGHRYSINATLKCTDHPWSQIKFIGFFNLVHVDILFSINTWHFSRDLLLRYFPHDLDLKNLTFFQVWCGNLYFFSQVSFISPHFINWLWQFHILTLLSGILFPPPLFCLYIIILYVFHVFILVIFKQLLIGQLPLRYSLKLLFTLPSVHKSLFFPMSIQVITNPILASLLCRSSVLCIKRSGGTNVIANYIYFFEQQSRRTVCN